jgi:hypothetical protein
MPEPNVNTGVSTLAPQVADAGATAVEETVDTGADAGDAGDAADAGDVDAGGDQGDVAADDQADVGDQAGDDDQADPDGKDLSVKEINAKFKELSGTEFGKANASWLKQLRHDYNSLFSIKQIFPTPQDAKSAKDLLASLGDNPMESLQGFEQARLDLDTLEAAIASSDPDFIRAQFDRNPEGMAGLAPAMLGETYARNPEAYQKMTTPLIYNAFTHKSGPVGVMAQASQLLRSGKAEDVQRAIQTLDGFGNVLEEMENYIKGSQNDPLKPQKDKLATREKELNAQSEKNFDGSVDAQIFPIRDRIIDKALDPYIRGKNFDAARLNAIKRNILQELQSYAGSDKAFMSQYGAVRAKKNVQSIVKFTGGKLEEILPGMVTTVAQQFGLSTSQNGKAGLRDRQRTVIRGDAKGTSGGKQAAEGTRDNPIRTEPNIRDVDTKRTSTMMRVSQKQAWTRDGKFYSWGDR